ncbi:hypothetical protein IB268_26420 [Achromobacter sp. ACM01]|uniref:hypothetical protein n=1 Tax=Achromobacter sp. ACM01 TaxID=2769298 RepID=UPI0017824405|nr:hypothetical protein [Achromobacter sp. ACM01]MBD9476473.1 hypothetical protein [Achromobacter sp. ACM01]
MDLHEFASARDTLFKILETQPGLFGSGAASANRGRDLAEMAWGFIDEFHRQRQEKVKD